MSFLFPEPPLYSDISPFSHNEIRTVVLVGMITAPFSIIGSILVLFSIIYRKMYNTVYGRLMFGVTVGTLITSIILSIGPLPNLESLMGDFGAKGNTTTCTTAGFLLLTSSALTILYFAALMLNFFLTIGYGYSERYIKEKIEIYLHCFCIFSTIIVGIIGIVKEFYNPSGLVPTVCFVNAYPGPCVDIEWLPCERGENAFTFLMYSVVIPALCLYVFNNICLIMVFRTVRKRESETRSLRRFSTFKYYKTVERQTSMYAISFFFSQAFIVILPLTHMLINPLENQVLLYRMQIASFATYPLQGFWNFLIFVIPRYAKIRGRNRNVPRTTVIRHAVFSRKESNMISIASQSVIRQATNSTNSFGTNILSRESTNNKDNNNNNDIVTSVRTDKLECAPPQPPVSSSNEEN